MDKTEVYLTPSGKISRVHAPHLTRGGYTVCGLVVRPDPLQSFAMSPAHGETSCGNCLRINQGIPMRYPLNHKF